MSTPNRPEDLFQNLREGFSEIGRRMSSFMEEVGSTEADSVVVRTDAYYTADAYVLELELPGVKKEEVSIQMNDGVLSVKGDKKPAAEGKPQYERRERLFGSFIRDYNLPPDADAEKVKAKYDGGVLTIRFARILQVSPEKEKGGISVE